MWIVDSSVWIDFFGGACTSETDLLSDALGAREIGLCDIVLVEVLQGFRADADLKAGTDALLRFPVFEAGGLENALLAARHYRELRRRGITPRSTIDCLIATFVIANGHQLLHSDRDFEPFETLFGLRVVRGVG